MKFGEMMLMSNAEIYFWGVHLALLAVILAAIWHKIEFLYKSDEELIEKIKERDKNEY